MAGPHDDGFKWFGEGFDGFPKRIQDDTVEYSMYAIDEKLDSIATTIARLKTILQEAKSWSDQLTKDYIWQRDSFKFHLRDVSKRQKSGPASAEHVGQHSDAIPHLAGQTTFGDAIADEWLIVYMLVELSKRFSDAWITVTDPDGEFLLIEAASALPKWLNPDVAANRVWISNGHLRLIPLDEDEVSKQHISREEALHFIKHKQANLLIPPDIEHAAFTRIRAYPDAIQESLHHALIAIPRQVAYLLHENPAYISPAVEAFYMRDLVSLKPLQTKDLATLTFPPEDLVTTSVKFTKVNYAQLRSQIFEAPPAWVGLAPKLHDENTLMGMKLTCGFEMLLADPANKDNKVVREIRLLLDDIETGEAQLPSEKEIAAWSTRQDSEKWLDVDYADFETELSGKGGKSAKGDPSAGGQDHIHELVSRFQDFVNDDDAAGVEDESDGEDTESSVSSTGEDKDGSYSEAEFEQAMKDMMGMSDVQKQETGLLDEARKLALEDGEDDVDVDEETKEMMRRMEAELKGHGALGGRGRGATAADKAKKPSKPATKPVVFGPPRPPGLASNTNGVQEEKEESADEDVGPGDGELSSDDEDFNEVDVNLARNLLQSFKGQAGMSGPAGNMLKALGMTLPRDEDDDDHND